MAAREVVERYLELLANKDVDRAGEHLAADFIYRPEGDVRVPKDHYLTAVRAIFTALPDFALYISGWQVADDHVSVQVGGEGTHTGTFAYPVPGFPVVEATGNRVHRPPFEWVFTVDNDQIVELVFHMVPGASARDMLRQMGADIVES
jgi:ketosteroid isomerase-like protein